MSHQDDFKTLKCSELLRCLQWLLAGASWQDRPIHAASSWSFPVLVSMALAWGWSMERTLGERFNCAQRLVRGIFGDPRHFSYQAFIEALKRHGDYLREILQQAFRRRMMELSSVWTYQGFVLLGMDGSEVNAPRTTDNKARYTTNGKSPHQRRKKRKKADKQRESPRILWTTIFHIQLGLPWNWQLGSKNEGERGQLCAMLSSLPVNSLLVGDAGFVGYDFLAELLRSGADVLVRVGANVNLLRRLGTVRERNNIVYVWPNATARKKKLPPLRFRLVVKQGPRSLIYMITSVLDPSRLSDHQVAEIYARRWGIELFHRHFKQTFGCRKMLSKNADNLIVELTWKLLALWAMLLYGTHQIIQSGHVPHQLSPTLVIKAFHATARDYLHLADKRDTLKHTLARALKDNYQRKGSKDAVDYPRQRKHKPPGAPEIQEATKAQRDAAKPLIAASMYP